ncbi:hypothetical protein KBD61_02525 [Patescibacteria group bacterium]|nr:hypothetical protein [Patescibacteria group bacterium]MBP9709881.1 hypothetical protein [Patescibacteria group bacterium]
MKSISLSERLESIQTIFGLVADDTRMNREGRLSERHAKILEDQAKRGGRILTIAGILVILLCGLAVLNAWTDRSNVDMVGRLFVSLACLVGVFFGVFLLKLAAKGQLPFSTLPVLSIEGVVTLSRFVGNNLTGRGRYALVSLVVNGKEYFLEEAQRKAFVEGERYRVYYIEPNTVVNAEPV